MYRADRFSQVNNSWRTPLIVTAVSLSVITFVVACRSRREKKVDTTVSSTPGAIVTPQSSSGEVDSVRTEPPVVTFAAAQAAYSQRKYAEAAESFGAYVERHPKNPSGFYMLGLSAWKSGQLDRADSGYESAIALDPKNVKSFINVSRVLLDQDRLDDARERIGQALALDSGNAESWRVLGRVEGKAGRLDDALGAYHTALSIDPQDAWSMNNMGLLLLGAGRYDEALGPLARAVQLDDSVPSFQNNLGLALERTGHITLADQAYQAALAIDSTYDKARVSLTRLQGHSDQPGLDSVTVASLGDAFAGEIEGWRASRKVATTDSQPDSVKRP